jgi:CheY-like chemotaxis protein
MTKPLHWDVHGQLYVLGVDDDQVNLMVVEQLLGSEGYKASKRFRMEHIRSNNERIVDVNATEPP